MEDMNGTLQVLRRILTEHIDKFGIELRIEVKYVEKDGLKGVRHDVIGPEFDGGNDMFYFSVFVTLHDLMVGIWTRELINARKGPFDVVRMYKFDPGTFDEWLKEHDEVYEQLTA